MIIFIKYIKSLIILGFIFFITQFLIFQNIELIDFINFIIIPAFLISSILSIIDSFILYKKGYKLNQKSKLKIKNTGNLNILKNNLSNLNLKYQERNNKIIIKMAANYYQSFGEIITIEENEDYILINSHSKIALTIFDYGKNIDNVLLIKELLAS